MTSRLFRKSRQFKRPSLDSIDTPKSLFLTQSRLRLATLTVQKIAYRLFRKSQQSKKWGLDNVHTPKFRFLTQSQSRLSILTVQKACLRESRNIYFNWFRQFKKWNIDCSESLDSLKSEVLIVSIPLSLNFWLRLDQDSQSRRFKKLVSKCQKSQPRLVLTVGTPHA